MLYFLREQSTGCNVLHNTVAKYIIFLVYYTN
jgi:hypothetical protein